MQGDLEDQNMAIEKLKAMLEIKQTEFEELQGTLREAVSEGKQLDSMIEERDLIIQDLEAQLQ